MEYNVQFRIKLDGREVIDTIVVDAKNEKEALKKVKENTLSHPKIVSLKEVSSKIDLSRHEEKIVKDVFDQALKEVFGRVVELYKKELDEREFSRNRIIVRLAELFDDEVETNY